MTTCRPWAIPAVLALLAIWCATAFGERTLDEFKAYVQERLPGQLTQAQLDELVKKVDKDHDQVISDAEFETRMDMVQEVMAGEPDRLPRGRRDRRDRRDRRERMSKMMQARLERAGIGVGQPLPNAAGLDIHGQPFELASLRGHYSVIISGCLT